MAPDAEFNAHIKICNMRFEQQAEQNRQIDARLRSGDALMQELRDLLVELKPVAAEVKLHASTIYGDNREGGLVRESRETRQDVDRINKTALAISGLFTTNIVTLITLLVQWIRNGGGKT